MQTSLDRESVKDTDLQLCKTAGRDVAGISGGATAPTDSRSSDISIFGVRVWGSRRPVGDPAWPGPCVAEVEMSEMLQFVFGIDLHFCKSAGQDVFRVSLARGQFSFCNFSDI